MILNLNYWIRMRPGALAPLFLQVLVIIVVLMLVGAFAFHYLRKSKNGGSYRRIWQKLSGFCAGNAIIGAFITFFAFEQIPFLAMRLWFLLWLAGAGVWLFFIAKAAIKIPEIKKQRLEEEQIKKYIP